MAGNFLIGPTVVDLTHSAAGAVALRRYRAGSPDPALVAMITGLLGPASNIRFRRPADRAPDGTAEDPTKWANDSPEKAWYDGYAAGLGSLARMSPDARPFIRALMAEDQVVIADLVKARVDLVDLAPLKLCMTVKAASR